MKWIKSTFRGMERSSPHRNESTEPAAIFEKLHRFLNDERAQNNQLPESYRSEIQGGLDCDEISGANGEFGRSFQNPIPVKAQSAKSCICPACGQTIARQLCFTGSVQRMAWMCSRQSVLMERSGTSYSCTYITRENLGEHPADTALHKEKSGRICSWVQANS
jgi:hypothetical protein